ncbi:MAG: sugar phosphate isomerase/epimerase family protein [Verrucomicrobiota bacterium]
MIFLTGFADEAADNIDGQIRAIQQLGWSHIELRSIDKINITDIPNKDFEIVADQIEKANLQVNAFGSTICNWGKSILEPMDRDLEEIERAIPRMQALGTRYVRIMSYGVLRDRDPNDQFVEERIKRLNQVVERFADAGLQALHENCANYGGMGWQFTQRLLDGVPGLQLIFDTANPATTLDRSKPMPYPTQSPWEFYQNVRDHIAHVHVKDGRFIADNPDSIFEDAEYVWPGEGDGDVKRIVEDLIHNGYQGGFSIEPHLSVVYHDENQNSPKQYRFESFIEYGKRLERIIDEIRNNAASTQPTATKLP